MAITAKIGKRNTWTVNVGVYNGGTHDHSKLFNRDADDQHPMGAIKGLETFAKNTNAHMASKENPHGVTADQVGARPDTWMPTASQVGAAPDGYGLGEGNSRYADDINKAILPGWYHLGEQTVNVPAFAGSGYILWNYSCVFVQRRNSTIWQHFYTIGVDGVGHNFMSVRVSSDAGTTWSELEYLNPPMIPGVEYRTTERYNGKPVYAKVVSFGNLPNNSSASASWQPDTGYTDSIVDARVIANGNFVNVVSSVNSSAIWVETSGDYSALTATVILKYTKS